MELLTKQLVISLAFTVILFDFIRQVSKRRSGRPSGSKRSRSSTRTAGRDQGPAQVSRLGAIQDPDQLGKTKGQAIETARAGDSKLLLVIPKGFGDSLAEPRPRPIETYSFMRSFSPIGARGKWSARASSPPSTRPCRTTSSERSCPIWTRAGFKKPIKSKDFVVVQDKMAEGSANDVAGMIFNNPC